jgi:exodeoxyribonuclease VII small subunit
MSSKSKNTTSFAQQLGELEAIAAWFESDQADLEGGVDRFEKGLTLVTSLRAQLQDTENRIEKVKRNFAEGSVGVAPVEPSPYMSSETALQSSTEDTAGTDTASLPGLFDS